MTGEEKKYSIGSRWLGGLFAAVIVLWAANFAFAYLAFSEWDKRGQFGDLFGAANSLFSGLAFVGLIVAIRLQSQELSLQRLELQLQRQEMADSRAELAKQAEATLSLYRATVAQVRVAAAQARIEHAKTRIALAPNSVMADMARADIEREAIGLDELAEHILAGSESME